MTATLTPKKQLLVDFLREVWSEGKVEAVSKYLSSTYTIHNDPGDPWHGQALSQDGFRERLVTSRAAAPDQVFTVERMVEDGADIAVAWTWKGTHLGDLPGMPATGKPLNMTGLTIYDFVDSRLAGHWQVADRLSIYQQIMSA
jgi:steroid delta-isomerase-like uncharacterized protein